MPDMPKLYIIAGCNGAGKTTASYTVLPEMLDCREFVNADEIAKGLSPFNPESVAIDAGAAHAATHGRPADRRRGFRFRDDAGHPLLREVHRPGTCDGVFRFAALLLASHAGTSDRARCDAGEQRRSRHPRGGDPPPLRHRHAQPWSHSTLRCATTGSSTTTVPPMPISASSHRARTTQQSTSKIR